MWTTFKEHRIWFGPNSNATLIDIYTIKFYVTLSLWKQFWGFTWLLHLCKLPTLINGKSCLSGIEIGTFAGFFLFFFRWKCVSWVFLIWNITFNNDWDEKLKIYSQFNLIFLLSFLSIKNILIISCIQKKNNLFIFFTLLNFPFTSNNNYTLQ